jgi:hypothetical protein
MKTVVLVLLLGGGLLSCAGLPTLQQADGPAAWAENPTCLGFFPVGQWQLLHALEARLPGGRTGFLIGLTRLSSQEQSAHCVIMTLEGFVVFDARDDGQVTIERAVAPFDNDAFAQGVMADIRLIFFKPQADETIAGTLADGTPACRHHLQNGTIIDVVQRGDSQWETRLYHADHRLKRVVKSRLKEKPPAEGPRGIADTIELTALGTPGYKLVLDLVEAIPLKPEGSSMKGSNVDFGFVLWRTP